ncbi:MAG: Lrp/AsnC family transcriptional regulator [Chloroflexota bacterium]
MRPHILDEIDHRILELLHSDARKSNVELARQTGRSEGAIRRRIRYLTKNGYLAILAFADPLKLGYNVHTVTGLKVGMGKVRTVAQQLATMNEVTYINVVAGHFDIIFHAWFKDLPNLNDFLSDKLPSVRGITGSETYTVLEITKRTYGYIGELLATEHPKRARAPRRRKE